MEFDTSGLSLSRQDIGKPLIFPTRLTENLSEFLGIMVGDGHLGQYNLVNHGRYKKLHSEISISGNINERIYHEYVNDLFFSLFGFRMKYKKYPASRAVLLAAYSRGLVQFLNKVCGIPVNRKTPNLRVPDIILNSSKGIRTAFLRGLADTDFSFAFKYRPSKGHIYPVIRAAFNSRQLISCLIIMLDDLGFRYYVQYDEITQDKRFGPTVIHNIYLYGKDNCLKWIKEIGFSNPKFQRKYKKWLRDGYCPPGY